jgi:membrane-associated phospholipid phosphatase
MIEDGQASPWYRQAAAVVPLHPYLKGIGTTVFISLFFVAYFYVLKNPAYPPTVMPVIWLDRMIGFEPLALPVYLSLWLYVSLLPAFFSTRAELYRYGVSMAAMCLAGLSIFYFWPTGAPAPDIDWARYPDIDFLKNIDAAGNACPSLHVATAFFSAIWFHHLLRRFGGPPWILALNWTWCFAIVYSTIAIRQHVVVDAGAGLLLGGLAAWLSLRSCVRSPAAVKGRCPSS